MDDSRRCSDSKVGFVVMSVLATWGIVLIGVLVWIGYVCVARTGG